MKKNLNESKELARWIGDSRHDTELEANIDTLTECLPCLISIAAVSAEQDKKALGKPSNPLPLQYAHCAVSRTTFSDSFIFQIFCLATQRWVAFFCVMHSTHSTEGQQMAYTPYCPGFFVPPIMADFFAKTR
ncbi:MAG: hypothetical protein IKK36_02735 [Bacteroidales bacterium]|nr:hypothetical protein [Bacteroidales bacterium]